MYRVLRAPLTPSPPLTPHSILTPEEDEPGWLDRCFVLALVISIVAWILCCIGLMLFGSSLVHPNSGMVSDCADLLWVNRMHVGVHMVSLLWIPGVFYLFSHARSRDAVYGWSVAVTVVCIGFVVLYSLLMGLLSVRIDLAGPNSACARAMGVGPDLRPKTDLVDHAQYLKNLDILCLVGYALGSFSGFVPLCARCLRRGDGGGKEAP
jgi:hypothetical protein